ncbi:pilus assembly FimT family protein [Campylobacter curvus]|uniref:pilus assembly FimT family protein n=2 Tax=Campylobacter curvus TaxID=200 RepID=UPI003211A7B6
MMKMVRNRAFTMIELVFVIVIVGILASLAIPRLERNGAKEAAEQILSHIRYTQHLALQDDKFSVSEKEWYKGRWRIYFNYTTDSNDWRYVVFYDMRGTKKFSGNPNNGIVNIANDPSKPGGKLIDKFQKQSIPEKARNKNLNLTKRYSIGGKYGVIMSKECSGNTIAFDNIGRPYSALQNSKGPYDKLLKKECIVALKDNTGHQAKIHIEPETGFAYITYN